MKNHLLRAVMVFFLSVAAIAAIAYIVSGPYHRDLIGRYAGLESAIGTDRHGQELFIEPNSRGFYARYSPEIPENIARAFVRGEDRFFYYHMGFNPLSAFRSVVFGSSGRGSSTITQQLVKVLLGQEQQRTVQNKLRELAYALALELHAPKKDILAMYANAAYFGGGVQGIAEASRHYFAKGPGDLTGAEVGELLRALRSPGTYVPRNAVADTPERRHDADFELRDLGIRCTAACALSIDSALTAEVREILRRNIQSSRLKGARNGAVVVVRLPENEVISLIGSPDPSQDSDGYRINMARRPRQVGSTIKPFIYGRAFELGLRPYTRVDDREYRYTIGSGFALYPKNYDYQYRGEVSLHYALANSLNVPTVKTLEYIGADGFAAYLTGSMGFKPMRDPHEYGLGIALGVLEMDLTTLAHYFTIFANGGELKPLTLEYGAGPFWPAMEEPAGPRRVLAAPHVELINRILTDRVTGVEQFGIRSALNLPYDSYAVKTGTSRDFHDSWTVGYTPDFLVAVWVGNADDSPMDQVSGSVGAGVVWHDVMELLYASPYNRKTAFTFPDVVEYPDDAGIEYGLAGDDYVSMRQALMAYDGSLILSPHNGDVILLDGAEITLRAKEPARWYVDGKAFGTTVVSDTVFRPVSPGTYRIQAKASSAKEEAIAIEVVETAD